MNRYGTGPVCFPVRAALFLIFTVVIAIAAAPAQTPGITDNSILDWILLRAGWPGARSRSTDRSGRFRLSPHGQR